MLNLPTQHPTDYRALRVTRATLIKITLSQNSIVLRAFPTTQLPDEPGIPSLKTPYPSATLIKITLSQNSIVLRADEPGIPSLKTPSICNARETYPSPTTQTPSPPSINSANAGITPDAPSDPSPNVSSPTTSTDPRSIAQPHRAAPLFLPSTGRRLPPNRTPGPDAHVQRNTRSTRV